MRGSSRSAEHVALFRALEHSRRHDRLFADGLATRMLPPGYRAVVAASRVPAVHRWIVRYIDTHYAGGPRASAVVRTRLIDDRVEAALAAGATQLVLLGAGFDNRAHRIAAPVAFEVDHPATQATKRRRAPAGGVRFVPVDLAVDALAPALQAAGFDAAAPAVVVWEGVTNYLTAEAVDTTLRALAGLLAPGSTLIFTYVDRAALDGTGAFDGVAEWHAAVQRGGEPWTFGFKPAQLRGYLSERGLHLTEDLSTRDAAAVYLRPLGRTDEPTAEFYRIAVADA
ncbi:class I SAM-dependent methyltransferase [Dactylosporangium vinaceum]|uniref:S-adenosyl-L-methionine-dependent methyltransferase n=1 Tax=Dactylosporangium vinaceum TaxID=53362 RepID=A0ABV5MGC4_9ACTN|nr:SAM-dependent methyltransferase [Dactylosporangium vinaceum]UAB99033.1 class I SAM-dependent methyltransferase [Dactylosporangium vinaceum]